MSIFDSSTKPAFRPSLLAGGALCKGLATILPLFALLITNLPAHARPHLSYLDNPPGPQFTDWEKQTQMTAGDVLKDNILAAFARGAASYRVPAIDYRWDSNGLVFEHLVRDDARPFTIDAFGATFWMDRGPKNLLQPGGGLEFRNCRNIHFKGATLDLDPPTDMQGRVSRWDRPNDRFEIVISPGSPSVERSTEALRLYKPDGARIPDDDAIAQSITASTPGRMWVDLPHQSYLLNSENPEQTLTNDNRSTLQVGDGVVVALTRTSMINIVDSGHISIQDVNIYGDGDNSEEGGEGGHLWKNVKMTRRPKTNRLWGSGGISSKNLEHASTYDHVEVASGQNEMSDVHGHPTHGIGASSPNQPPSNNDQPIE